MTEDDPLTDEEFLQNWRNGLRKSIDYFSTDNKREWSHITPHKGRHI